DRSPDRACEPSSRPPILAVDSKGGDRLARAKRPDTPSQALVRVLWRMPLVSVPFAVFFGAIFGAGWHGYLVAYESSIIIAYTVMLCVGAVGWFVPPRLPRSSMAAGGSRYWLSTAIFPLTGVLASFLGALIVNATVLPGVFENLRGVVVFGLYALLFALLFTGIAYMTAFYRQSIQRAKAEQELNLARRIQRSFLISNFPSRARLEVHAVNVSSKEGSGDFYDVVQAGDDALLLAIADVAGKGIPAALLSSMLQASLRTQANSVGSAAAILCNINGLVYPSTALNQFATFFLARVDERALPLTYSNAGHNHPVLFRADGRREALARGGTVVGIMEHARYEEGAVDLSPGDRLILYTDGISEADDGTGALFGEERLLDLVAALPRDLPARDTTERIVDGVRDYLKGLDPGDDMTVMVLRVRE